MNRPRSGRTLVQLARAFKARNKVVRPKDEVVVRGKVHVADLDGKTEPVPSACRCWACENSREGMVCCLALGAALTLLVQGRWVLAAAAIMFGVGISAAVSIRFH